MLKYLDRSEFENNNKNICKMIIDGKEYKINGKYKIKHYNNNKLEMKLKGVNNITNMDCMFDGSSSLLSLPYISLVNIHHYYHYLIFKNEILIMLDMRLIFYGCSSLSSLPDISKWNTNNAIYMRYMFYGCSLLSSLPDISKWNTNNVSEMQSMFKG